MDISCEMGLPFSEPSSLTGTSFESSTSDLPVKLLGSSDDHLLHGNSDKHLNVSDFKLDLGPANDLVGASDFDHGISTESLMTPEESSEGYSISDAALEGGARPAITASNVVAIDNINYVQSIPLVSSLSGIQAVQVIPFGYLISGSKSNLDQQLIPIHNSINSISQSNSTHIQPVHNAVVIGNVMMLKTLDQSHKAENEDSEIKKGDGNVLHKSLSKVKFTKNCSSDEMSRKVANKKNIISTRIHQNNSNQRHQKNTKVKIDGKTISLTFEVKNVGNTKEIKNTTNKIPNCIEMLDESDQSGTKSPHILTEAPTGSTRYVSLLSGQNNCVTIKKNEDPKSVNNATFNINAYSDRTDIEMIPDNKKSKSNFDKTAELENEVLTLLAKASEERSRVEQEQSKVTPGRKKSGKPCGNLPCSEELFTCDICGLTFNRHGNFTRHKLIHDVRLKERYKCTECDKKFLQRCDLKRHLLIHTNQEPYRCQECGKGYIRRSDLVVHMRFHKKERVFACPYCPDKKFCQSGDLNRHVRNVHLHSSTYKCRLCDRQFSRDSALIQHEYTCHDNSSIQSSKKKNRTGTSTATKQKKKNESN